MLHRPPPAAPQRLGLLRRADFRRLWIGETTSAFGSSVSPVALPLVALTVLHAGVVVIAVLDGLVWLPWLVIGLPAGAWVDRLPRRAVMMVCDAVSLIALVSVPVAVWTGVLTLAQLIAVAVAVGSADVFFSSAYRAFLPALLADDELVRGNSHLQAAESAAQVAGPGAAGLLAETVGAVTGVLVDALSFAVSLLCLRGLNGCEKPVLGSRRSLRTDIADGMRLVLRDRLLRSLMLFGAAANLVLSGFGAITVVYLVRGVGLSAGTAGVLIAVGQLGAVAGALFAPRLARSIGSARTLLATKLAAVPVALLIPLTAPDWRLAFFVVGDMALAGGITAGNVVQRGFSQAYVPPEMMGRVGTSTQVVNYGLIPVGAVLGGVLAGSLGFRPTLWLLLSGLLLASLVLLGGPLRGIARICRPARAWHRPQVDGADAGLSAVTGSID